MSEWIYDPTAGRCRKTVGGQAMSDIDDCRKFVENLTRDRGEVMRAGDDKIAEIRAWNTSDTWRRYDLTAQMRDDRAFLLAEDARHRAENERLRAEIELLRAALKGIDALDPDVPDALVADALRGIVMRMGDLARNALEGKQ